MIGIHNYVIFGIGKTYKTISKLLEGRVDYYIDNDENKWNTYINGKIVLPVPAILERKFERILICSFVYESPMREQLNNLNISSDVIDNISDWFILNDHENGGRINY